jgi:hypothetical protein
MGYLKEISQYSPGKTEENNEQSQAGHLIINWLRSKLDTSGIKV